MKTNKKSPVGYTVAGIIGLAGGSQTVADACGVPNQSVTKWRYIPSWHASKVAVMAGLPLAIVRPDLVAKAEAEIAIYQGKAA